METDSTDQLNSQNAPEPMDPFAPAASSSPVSYISPKQTPNRRLLAGLVVLFLILVLPMAFWLGQQNQDIRQRAYSVGDACGLSSDLECLVAGNATIGVSCTKNGQSGTCQATTGDSNGPTCVCIANNACVANNLCLTNTTQVCCSGNTQFDPNCTATGSRCTVGGPGPSAGACGNGSDSQCTGQNDGDFCGTGLACALQVTGNCLCQAAPKCDAAIYPCLPTPNDQCSIINGQDTSAVADGTCSVTGARCCPPGTGGGNPSPTPTPTPPAGACVSTHLVSVSECSAGSCTGCQRRIGINVSDTTGQNCGDVCTIDNTCCNAPVPTPTPGTGPAAQCTAVKLFRVTGNIDTASNWHLLTQTEIQNLRAGDIIYLTTTGTTANGPTITRARLQVANNNAAFGPWIQAQHDTTRTRPGSSPVEYYLPYTIPSSIYTFKIGAEVYSPQFDTNGTPWDSNAGWR